MSGLLRAWPGVILLLGFAACGTGASSKPAPRPEGRAALAIPVDHHILVDQFGYLPDESKMAVIRDPRAGYDKEDHFSPGPVYQLRKAADGAVVLSGSPSAWNGGTVDALSGDRGWWFDFSAAAEPGRYFVFDVAHNARSPGFEIGPHVYRDILKAALRTYFYQRSAMVKAPAFAGACWADEPAYVGKDQDTQARDVTDRANRAKIRDLSGGWFDAGDTNKYVTFAAQAVHQLLTAYAGNATAFTDDDNIPESGNAVPDVLDEVRWETDWLKKMQSPDGSFLLKVGEITYVAASPPSSDHSPRYYVPGCTSATIAGAGMMAHAAYVFAGFPALTHDVQELKERAIRGWEQYQRTPEKQTACDSGVVHAGLADLSVEDQQGLAVEAAIYLFAVTQDAAYEAYVEAHHRDAHPYHDAGWSRYKADQGEALLFYAGLPFAKGSLAATIRADKQADVNSGGQIYGFAPDDDLYRAFLNREQYHWGSNNPRANYGNSNLDVIQHGLATGETSTYRTRALGMLHYLHGVNPFGMVYLSNMYSYGATRSANEIYHVWFADKTRWSDALTSECGPPPGYLPGGPNAAAQRDGVPSSLSPPTGQPPQKSYKDWNGAYPDSSWAVTEPGIYYQSAYIRLLSAFVF